MHTITVPPNTNLRNVFNEAKNYPHVQIKLLPGHHTWAFCSDWEYDPNHGWYLDGPQEIASDEQLRIEHPHLVLTGSDRCTFPPHHIWYDPSTTTIDPCLNQLNTIMYHTIANITYARCGDVVPADWRNVTPGELLIINEIDDPYNDESCWEGVDELGEQVRTNLQHVFEKPFHTLED